MHFLARASALALLIAGMAAGAAHAQTATTTSTDTMGAPAGVSGTFVGSPGGTWSTWMVDLPSGKDVTLKLAYWPCNSGGAVGFDVWGATAHLASSSQADACTQHAMFATGDGGKAEIKAYNYLPGVPVWYTLTADGMTLPGATAPAATTTTTTTTAATTTMAPATTTTTMAPATTTTAMAPAAAPAAMAMAASDTLNVQNQTLLGNGGGAASRHDLMVKEGQTYTVKLNYGTDMGGTWPGIGFKVWGPDGWVANSHSTGLGMAESTFTSTGDVKYTVEVYNYHPGVTAFYGLNSSTASTN
jgi:hypothetical protein